jgi:K+-transporting ATPase ATPase A chain
MVLDVVQMVVVLAILMAIAVPLGQYMAVVFTGGRTWLDSLLDPFDRAICRLSGVRPDEQQRWPAYVKAMLLTNLAMFVLMFAVLELQPLLPLNPDGQGFVNPWLAFNTAASFITNTNWQNYGGESTLSYFSQLFALIFPMFTSATTGLACGIAFIRGLAGNVELGNFYVDLTRSITRVLLPGCIVLGVVYVGLGIPSTFGGAVAATTLNGPRATPVTATSPVPSSEAGPAPEPTPSDASQGIQLIARGLVAPWIAVKHLGTNGGGWFGANSSHPFENPRPLTNVLEVVSLAAIPTALIYTLGVMLNRRRQALVFFGVMAGFYLVFLALAYGGEMAGNPLLTAQGLDPAQGNLEGKEQRFGQAQTALFVTGTTAFTTGSVDAMHDSLTPLGSLTPLAQMMLNMIFGGKGVGFITLIIFAILGVFLTGLMVGRTPEFLGKKLEAYEVKLAAVSFLMHPLLILAGMALTFALKLDLDAISNPSFHGFSEVMYAYTSAAANNGSAFAGLSGNTPWWNASLGVVMLLGRYVSIVLMLALAGSLAAKKPLPHTAGTMRTDDLLFAVVLAGTVLILGALTFFPILAIGPIAEHLAMLAGRTY